MDPRIASVVAEMERRLGDSLSIRDLAAVANLSTSRFRHLFRAETGMPPARYLRVLRLERARALLEHTFMSIKEVMAAVGCHDASHFARDFRKQYGRTPRAWRKALDVRRNVPPTRRVRDPNARVRDHGQEVNDQKPGKEVIDVSSVRRSLTDADRAQPGDDADHR